MEGPRDPSGRRHGEPAGERPGYVRLVYHYRDGHDFVTETMLRSEAVAYMPLLHAVATDRDHYEATFAVIELVVA